MDVKTINIMGFKMRILGLITFFISVFIVFTPIFLFAQFPGGGSGTEQDPYRIYTKEHFETFANVFSISGNGSNIRHFRLMNDITDTVKTTVEADGYFYGFNGYFHGGGHSININPSGVYLFYTIGVNGYLDSLEVVGTPDNYRSMVGFNKGVIYACTSNVEMTSIHRDLFFAGIAWENYGLIESCVNLTDCSAINQNGSTSFYPDIMSGISQWNENTIKKCKNKGNFTGRSTRMGGVAYINKNGGKIELCINSGKLTVMTIQDFHDFYQSGIVCINEPPSVVKNCINTGNITSVSKDTVFPSGITRNSEGLIENCLNTGNISGYIDSTINWGGVGISYSTKGNVNHCLNIGNCNRFAITDSIISEDVILDNNFYDKQMCLTKGMPAGDVIGLVEGKLTAQLTGTSPELQAMLGEGWSYAEGRYPIPLGLENDSMALVAAAPVYLHADDEENYNRIDSVNSNFMVSTNVATELITFNWDETYGHVNFNNENVTLLSTGEEILTVTLGNYNKKIKINIIGGAVFIPFFEKEIEIYPNPATRYITINLNDEKPNKLEIVDITGKIVFQTKNVEKNQNINLSSLKQGMYFLRIIENEKIICVKKIIKQA